MLSLFPIVDVSLVGILKVKSLVFFVSSAPARSFASGSGVGVGSYTLLLSLTDLWTLRAGSELNALGLSDYMGTGTSIY